MTTKLGNIMFKVGEYTDREGKTKGRYIRGGVLFEKDGEYFGTLEATPVGGEGKFSIWEDKPRQQTNSPPAQAAPQPQQQDDFGEDGPPF